MDNPINDVTQQVGDNFEAVRARIGHRARELHQALQHFVDDNPLGAVGIAFGAGYLLSGALFSRTTLRMATAGGRLVAGGLVRQLFAGVAPGLLDALVGAAGKAPAPSSSDSGSGNRPST